MPVVLIVGNDKKAALNHQEILARTAGRAHVFFSDYEAAKKIDRHMGFEIRTFENNIRVFYSDFDISDKDTYGNSICLKLDRDSNGGLTRRLYDAIHDIYMAGVHCDRILPSFPQVRIWALEASSNTASNDSTIIRARLEALGNDLEVALSLAAEVEGRNHCLQNELNKLRHEVEKSRIAGEERCGVFPPFKDVESWLTSQFTGVAIASRAVRELCDPKYNVYSKSEEIYKALVALGIYRTVASQDEQIARRLFDERLKELGLKDTFSTTATSRGVYGAEYAVIHEGEKIVLDRHIVGSSSRDPRYCLRIYYGYAGNGTLVIGSAPRHLTTGFS